MLSFPRVLAVAAAVVALSAVASAGGRVVTLSSPVKVGQFEVRNADRGLVKRVKVYFDQEKVATLVFRRGEATGFCCAADACKAVEVQAKCEAPKMLKLTCANGVCAID